MSKRKHFENYRILISPEGSRQFILLTDISLIRLLAAYEPKRDNDNTRRCCSSNAPSTTMKTITSQNYSRPSEALVAEAKIVPVGEQLLAVEQTTHDVIQAHLITNIHSAESVKRGILMHEAISKNHNVCYLCAHFTFDMGVFRVGNPNCCEYVIAFFVRLLYTHPGPPQIEFTRCPDIPSDGVVRF
jgi:hypothetical protein